MTLELSTMQRVTDTLKQDNQRLQHKCELASDLANQRMQEMGGMRRQLGELATVQYELEQLREEKRMLEGERDQMLERFNEYGEEMHRRQEHIIERVKRELRVKV